MGGIAKTVRLGLGFDLRDRVHAKGGDDADIVLVQKEAPEFMDDLAQQLVARAALIKGDRDSFRFMHDEVAIQLPALKRPTLEELQQSWNYIKRIERDDSTEGTVTLRLATVLKSTEQHIDGPTYERRLTVLRNQGELLGFQHLQYLLKVQQEHPALMALFGKVYVDFPGIVVVFQNGGRYVPYAGGDDDGRFIGEWLRLFDFRDSGRVAVSRKSAA